MNIQELKEFLNNFCLPEDKIEQFISNKSIVSKNNNIFLTNKKFEKNEIFDEGLIYIKLRTLLASKYLLRFIKDNSEGAVTIKNEKQALNYTYGKSLSFDSIEKNHPLIKNKYYIVEYNDNILGYAQIDKTKK
jgi:hypothetical protein